MTDLIDRQAALAVVEKMYKMCEGNLSDYHDLLVACITDLTPAQRWIPCKERLPGEDDSFYVLCCDTHGEVMIGHVFVCKDGEETPYSAESETEYMHDCLAWMPLPESYKEHDDD